MIPTGAWKWLSTVLGKIARVVLLYVHDYTEKKMEKEEIEPYIHDKVNLIF